MTVGTAKRKRQIFSPLRAGVGWFFATIFGWGVGFLAGGITGGLLIQLADTLPSGLDALVGIPGAVLAMGVAGLVAGETYWSWAVKGRVDKTLWQKISVFTGLGLMLAFVTLDVDAAVAYTCIYQNSGTSQTCTLTDNWTLAIILRSLIVGLGLGLPQWWAFRQSRIPRAFLWPLMWVGIMLTYFWTSTQTMIQTTESFTIEIDLLLMALFLGSVIPSIGLTLLLFQRQEKRKRKPKDEVV